MIKYFVSEQAVHVCGGSGSNVGYIYHIRMYLYCIVR